MSIVMVTESSRALSPIVKVPLTASSPKVEAHPKTFLILAKIPINMWRHPIPTCSTISSKTKEIFEMIYRVYEFTKLISRRYSGGFKGSIMYTGFKVQLVEEIQHDSRDPSRVLDLNTCELKRLETM
ncbi:hypothetical protein ACFE04_006639 [Oxalis oulophora]